MDNYLSKFKVSKQSELQALAVEIHEALAIPIPMLCGLIKRKGLSCVRTEFTETQKGDGKDKKALFLWKLKNIKIKYD